MTRVLVPVQGMTCAHCVHAVETAAKAVPGVKSVAVSLELQRAEVEVENADRIGAIAEAITGAGYAVGSMEVT